MSNFNEKELTKLYYSIGEVAAYFNVNASLIRFWEKEFDFQIAKKNAKGNRLFSVNEIKNFNKIYHLVKVEGYTLEGAKKMLQQNLPARSSTKNQDIIDDLEKIKEKLLRFKKE